MTDYSKIAVSSRIRLARNLEGYPFPSHLKDAKQAKDVIRIVTSGLARLYDFNIRYMDKISEAEALSLKENHLISPNLITNGRPSAVLINREESISIMINEEDHLRIQVLREGLALKEAAETASRIDTLLGENLDFAFDPEFGYLTQCPTNLGTGMRASVALHLPALTEAGSMPRIAANLSKLGLALRGAFGEGSRAVGDVYQLSNQITLGLSESQAIENLSSIAGQLIDEERRLRQEMKENPAWQDKVARAAGTLKTARLLSGSEAMELLSLARAGVSAGLLAGVELGAFNQLNMRVQPATLMVEAGRRLEEQERDQLRAKLVREALAPLRVE